MVLSIIIGVVSGVITLIIILLYSIANRNTEYIEMAKPLSKKEYPLKIMIPLGLHIMKICRYRHTRRNIKLREEFRELYGEEYMPYYMQMHIANKFGMGMLLLLMMSVFTLLYDVNLILQQTDELQIHSSRPVFLEEDGIIIRPDSSGNSRTSSQLPLEAVFGVDNEEVVSNYNFTIPEQIPSDADCVRLAVENFEKEYIGQYREGLAQGITRSLKLSPFKIYRTSIQLVSEPTGYLSAVGELRERPLSTKGPVELQVKAIFSKGEEIAETQTFTIVIAPIPGIETAMQEVGDLEEALRRGKDSKMITETGVILPTNIDGVPIKWRIPEITFKNESYILLLLGVLMFFVVYFMQDSTVTKKVTEKRTKIRLEFPEFINKFVLLLCSGMTTNQALNRIMEDYDKLLSEKRVESMPLYEELRMMLNEVKTGKHDIYALEDFGLRCKINEVMKFVAAVTQNMKSGSMELVMILKTQSKDVWEARKNYARVKGEQAGTKLIFSMMLMVFAILVVVLYPAMSGAGL